MDKEKIIQMIEDYGSKQYEAGVNYGPADDMDTDDFKDLQMRIYNIESELNSRPVMPKAFDIWHSRYMSTRGALEGLMFEFVNVEHGNELDDPVISLMNWLYNGLSPAAHIDGDKLFKCIDAILHGYEVEE